MLCECHLRGQPSRSTGHPTLDVTLHNDHSVISLFHWNRATEQYKRFTRVYRTVLVGTVNLKDAVFF